MEKRKYRKRDLSFINWTRLILCWNFKTI